MTDKTPVEIPTPTIPKDLEALMGTINAYAQTNAVLHRASFPPQIFQAAIDVIGFIKSAHASAVEAALAHPSSDLVPELKAQKEKLESELKEKAE